MTGGVNWLTFETEMLIERETAVQAKLCHERIILGLGSLWGPVSQSVNEEPNSSTPADSFRTFSATSVISSCDVREGKLLNDCRNHLFI